MTTITTYCIATLAVLSALFAAAAMASDVVIVPTRIVGGDDAVVRQGDFVIIPFTIKNQSTGPSSVNARFDLIDYRLRRTEASKATLELPTPGELRTYVSFYVRIAGVYKAVITLEDGTEQQLAIFGVLPRSRTFKDETDGMHSRFGVHTTLGSDVRSITNLKLARKVGARWVRLHDSDQTTMWSIVEREKGQFRFVDDTIDRAREYGFNILGLLSSTPHWASSAPEGTSEQDFYGYSTYPAKNINDWEAYVKATVSHYKDRIKYWEVWNEADLDFFWKGSPELYAEYVRVASAAAKKVDPDCVVLAGGALFDHRVWADRSFQAGSLKTADILGLHPYGRGTYHGAYEPSKIGKSNLFLSAFADPVWIRRYDIINEFAERAGTPRPMWATETTVFGATFHSDIDLAGIEDKSEWIVDPPAVAAGELVKLYTISFSKVVEKVFYYHFTEWANPATASFPQSFLEYDGSPTGKLIAHAALSQILDRSKFAGQPRLRGGIYCYVFRKPRGSVAVLWSQWNGSTKMSVSLDANRVELVDIMGNGKRLHAKDGQVTLDLSAEPVYLTYDAKADQLLSAFQSSKLHLTMDNAR